MSMSTFNKSVIPKFKGDYFLRVLTFETQNFVPVIIDYNYTP